MSRTETRLCDAEGMNKILDQIAERIASTTKPESRLRLIGIRTRGVSLARRLAERVQVKIDKAVPVGAVDITLYRDDLSAFPHWPVLFGTEIPFEVEGADLFLVDDVVFTGRTVRAAINAICDLGRPARIRLAALVNRGPRELPIVPDIFGLDVGEDLSRPVFVRLSEVDGVDEIIQVDDTAHPDGIVPRPRS
jgi:pyrimidine operon attenuation protein/uracil phosphoribosyltransferase